MLSKQFSYNKFTCGNIFEILLKSFNFINRLNIIFNIAISYSLSFSVYFFPL